MNTIVILCGGTNSGKSATLKGFFKINYSPRRETYIERKFDGKLVCAVSFGSPQEQEDFCEVEDVNKNIENRIAISEGRVKGEQFVLLIPFTMIGNREKGEKINTDCILKPIEKLKKSFKVYVIYLRKKSLQNAERDALIEKITPSPKRIETTEHDYDKSTELEKYLKESVIKPH
jgi:hypothetical protein